MNSESCAAGVWEFMTPDVRGEAQTKGRPVYLWDLLRRIHLSFGNSCMVTLESDAARERAEDTFTVLEPLQYVSVNVSRTPSQILPRTQICVNAIYPRFSYSLE